MPEDAQFALDHATHAAVVVAVPEAEPVVGEVRARLDPSAAWGVPAHLTVLFPFVDPGSIDDDARARLVAAAASVPAFDCTFRKCGWFAEDVLWLAPDPAEPFRALTRAVWQAFPDHPPYQGEFDDLAPHLTVAQRGAGGVAELRDIEATVTRNLPVRTRVDRVILIAGNRAPISWRTAAEFPLG